MNSRVVLCPCGHPINRHRAYGCAESKKSGCPCQRDPNTVAADLLAGLPTPKPTTGDVERLSFRPTMHHTTVLYDGGQRKEALAYTLRRCRDRQGTPIGYTINAENLKGGQLTLYYWGTP